MSAMFLDAISGMDAGMKQAGAIIQQGQMQQVDAAWKNRELANKEELQAEQIATARSSRDLAATDSKMRGEELAFKKDMSVKELALKDKELAQRRELTMAELATKERLTNAELTSREKQFQSESELKKEALKTDATKKADDLIAAFGYSGAEAEKIRQAVLVDSYDAWGKGSVTKAREKLSSQDGSADTSPNDIIKNKTKMVEMVDKYKDLLDKLGQDPAKTNPELLATVREGLLLTADVGNPENHNLGVSKLASVQKEIAIKKSTEAELKRYLGSGASKKDSIVTTAQDSVRDIQGPSLQEVPKDSWINQSFKPTPMSASEKVVTRSEPSEEYKAYAKREEEMRLEQARRVQSRSTMR